jgi:arylsulfatase A-like enzyme
MTRINIKILLYDEPVAQEMFSSADVLMGSWKAVRNFQPVGDGQWRLFNLTSDIGENTDLAAKHPDILEKLISEYDKFAQEVGVVVPSGSVDAFQTVGEKSG